MRDLLSSNLEYFRYERKFYIQGISSEEIETILKFHPAVFKEIYHKRKVNSIYFDSFNLQYYFDNITGVDKRLKTRIRWYENLFDYIENPMLEVKIKHNQRVGKLHYPLKPFSLDKNFSIEIIRKVFRESTLNESFRSYLMDLNLSLLISYNRKYFLSRDQKYRITIDSDVQVYRLEPFGNNFLHKLTDYNNTTIELKYNNPHDEFADNITNYFPFRLTRSSKYVDGVRKVNSIT